MIPLIIDPLVTRLVLIGRGEIAQRRLALLDDAGAEHLAIYADAPSLDLEEAAGDRLRKRLPTASELAPFQIVWIADLPLDLALPLAAAVRAGGGLVNVEDVKQGCDFHNPAQVRRGDLLLTVSTNSQSPGLAARIRRQLGRHFGPEWAERLQRVGAKRRAWKRRSRSLSDLSRLTDAAIDSKGWLDEQGASR
ncbi:MAG: precorrin-2 dehydrogenase/sirohydrochlorin ferrochelatase family protein [Geminicoccaceae bacterium]